MALLDSGGGGVPTSSADQSSVDHYDTPWEFKNRALAAVLSQQRQQEQIGEKEGPENWRKGGQKASGLAEGEDGRNGRKRLSLPGGGGQRGRMPGKMGEKEQKQKQKQKMMMSNSMEGEGGGEGEKPTVAHHSPPSSGLWRQQGKVGQPPPLPAHHHGRVHSSPSATSSSSSAKSPLSAPAPLSMALAQTGSSSASPSSSPINSHNLRESWALRAPPGNGQKQQQQHRQDQQIGQQNNGGGPGAALRAYPLVSINPNSPNTKQVMAFCQSRSLSDEDGEDLSELVNERMERAEAELLLGGMPLGTHLLRRRPDRSLALSLKANEGVLHIKLEFRRTDGGAALQWVLGEGPRFRSINSMLRAYRRSELPVRGAEQIRLGALLRPGDVHGRGLLLL